MSDSPATGKRLSRPVFETARPARFVDSVIPIIIGTSSSPAWVGVAPVVTCRNSGTKTVIAKSVAVTKKNAAPATATTRVRRRSSGTIGSAARRSRTTSPMADATVAANNPTISAESHA